MDSVKKALNAIRQYSLINEVSLLEEKRVCRELEKIRFRLEHQQYKITSFCDNILNIPERNRDLFSEIEFYSSVGRELGVLFNALEIHKKTNILDIAPGFAPKVQLALYYLDYLGKLTMLDKDPDALKHLESFLNLFNVKYATNYIVGEIESIEDCQYDVIIGNHMIDDLVCNWFCTANHIDLKDVYENESLPKQIWLEITNSFDWYQEQYLALLSELFLKLIPSNTIFISLQYQSYFERSLGLGNVSKFNVSLNQQLRQRLLENNFEALPVPSSCAGKILSHENILALLRH